MTVVLENKKIEKDLPSLGLDIMGLPKMGKVRVDIARTK